MLAVDCQCIRKHRNGIDSFSTFPFNLQHVNVPGTADVDWDPSKSVYGWDDVASNSPAMWWMWQALNLYQAAQAVTGILRHKDPILVPCAAQTYSLTDNRYHSNHCLIMFRFQVSVLSVPKPSAFPMSDCFGRSSAGDKDAVAFSKINALLAGYITQHKQVMHLMKVRPIRHFHSMSFFPTIMFGYRWQA
jgi:hypothetical protein